VVKSTSRRPTAAAVKGSKSARTRERILTAAAEALSRNGYAGTRLTGIAEVAQLQTPAIYYYFSSREEVIEEVIRVGQRLTIDHVVQVLDDLPPGTSAIERILAAVEAHLDIVLSRSQYASASIRNMSQLPDDMRERQTELRREYGAIWRGLFEEAAASGELNPTLDPRAARMLIIGALNWTPEWWNPERGSADTVIENAKQLVRTGLTGP
jgi:AcrR family transcriptional regulator